MFYLFILIILVAAFACGVLYSGKVRGRISRIVGRSLGVPEEFNAWLAENSGKYKTLPDAVTAWTNQLKGDDKARATEALQNNYKKYCEALEHIRQ